MNTNHLWTKSSLLVATVGVSTGLACAAPLDIHRYDGVQIVFTQDLRSDFNEPGDRFTARVENDPLLPRDTVFQGRILRVHPANRYRAASMDMVFTSMSLPRGDTYTIDAVPTPANDPHLSRGADGRIVAAFKPGEESAYVFGGTVGGLILGGIGHRPILGGFIGGLIGSIAGATDRRENANLVIKKGEKMIAVFQEDVASTTNRPRGWKRYEGGPAPYGRRGLTPPPVTPSEGPGPDIRYDGTPVKFSDAMPYRDHGTVMVPLEYMANQFNLIATVHDDGSITVDGPDSSVQMHVGSASCSAPNGHGPLSRPVQEHNGVIYAPVDAFTRILSDPIVVDGNPIHL